MYINGANVPGVRPDWQAEKKPIRAYAQRLKGKQVRSAPRPRSRSSGNAAHH